MASIHRRVRWAIWGTLGLGWAAACAQVTSGVGGESHFVCSSQTDCDSRPGEVCFRANPSSETGECVSESVLRDAARHLGTGGTGGAAPASGGGAGTAGTGAAPNQTYCGASARMTYPDVPTSVPPSTRNVEIVAAQYEIDLGDDAPNPSNPPRHFLEIGFDLDNKCTLASDSKQFTCRAPSYALGVPDGPGGIDNAFGGLIQVIRNQIGNFSSDNYSNSIKAGKSNVILHLKDWNGEANDEQVTVSTMVAAPFDSFTANAVPAWLGSDAWPIASDAVNGDVNHPKFVDVNAYVSNYQVVATLAEENLRLDVGLTTAQFVNLDMKLTAAFVVCDIVPETTGRWGYTFSRCTLGGRWAANDLVKQLGQFPDPLNNNKPLCAGTDQYRTFRQGICSQVDIYHTIGSPTELCDALTLGFTYSMKPALLGNVFNLKPIADPCCVAPGCLPGSGEDYAINPKYDCCESIDAADGGRYQACGFPSPPAIVPPISPPVLPDAGGERSDGG